MFATLAGGLPVPPTAPTGSGKGADGVRRAVADQLALGLEPVSDGLLDWDHGSLIGTAVALGGRLTATGPRSRRVGAGAVQFEKPPSHPRSRFEIGRAHV